MPVVSPVETRVNSITKINAVTVSVHKFKWFWQKKRPVSTAIAERMFLEDVV